MGLQVQFPFNGVLNNQGLTKIGNLSSANTNFNLQGKMGQCLEITTTLPLNVPQSIYDVYSVADTEISYSVWVKIDKTYLNQLIANTDFSSKTQIYNKIIGFSTGTTSNGVGIHLCTISGLTSSTVLNQVYIYSYLRNGSYSNGSSQIAINLDQWYHLVVTYSKTNVLKFYIDGVLIDSRTVLRANLNTDISSKSVQLNHASCQLSNASANTMHLLSLKEYFNDVRIYDHALSDEEVKEISQGLILHYPLNRNNIKIINPNLLPDTNVGSLVKVVGPNNRYYESSTSGSYTATFEEISSPPVDGIAYGVHYTITSASGFHGVTWYSGGLISVETGQQYTLSCYAKKISSGNMSIKFQYGKSPYVAQTIQMKNDNNWHQYSWTFTPNTGSSQAAASGTTRIYGAGPTTVGEVLICGYKLEKGTVATPWCEYEAEGVTIGGLIDDCSGHNNNGVIVGPLQIDQNSVRYDASAYFSSSPYIKCTPFYLNTNQWTYSFWYYKTTQPSAYEGIICLSKGNGADANKKFAAMPNTNKIWLKCESGSGNLSSFNTSEWTHIVATSEGKVYENGVQKITIPPGTTMTNCTDLVIGARASASGVTSITTLFEGTLSDIRIYATVLSADDILKLYKTSKQIISSNKIPRDLE